MRYRSWTWNWGVRDGWIRFWHKGTLLLLPDELQQKLEAAEAELERLKAQLKKRGS